MGEQQNFSIKTLGSGSLLLDEALGCGGYPCGRIVEIYGPESSGKTTITLHAIAECQKRGGTAAFIDAEHALDPGYAHKLGVNVDELWLSQPDYGEQALEITDALARSHSVDLIVIDSVAALIPQAELNGEMGEHHVGLHARLMSQALRKLAGSVAKSGAIVFFINQIRMKIGVNYGNPETTTGGNALKFYASVRLEARKGECLGPNNEESFGHRIKVKVVKNKMAPPFRRVELELLFGKGLSRAGELIEAGLQHNLIQKSGSWFSWADSSLGQGQLGQGREAVRLQLEENPEWADRLEQRLRQLLFSPPSKTTNPSPEDPKSASGKLAPAAAVSTSSAPSLNTKSSSTKENAATK